MKLKAILFDLDGTLLPMEQDVFIHDYMKRLAASLAPLGYDPQALVSAIWAGTGAMVKNDGDHTNEAVFAGCSERMPGRTSRNLKNSTVRSSRM